MNRLYLHRMDCLLLYGAVQPSGDIRVKKEREAYLAIKSKSPPILAFLSQVLSILVVDTDLSHLPVRMGSDEGS